MFCEKCGAEVKQTTKFCPGCGQPVQAAQPAQPDITSPPTPEPVITQPAYTPPPAPAPQPAYQPQPTMAGRTRQPAPARPKRKAGSIIGGAAVLCIGWLLVAAGATVFYALYGVHASVWLDGAVKIAAPAGAGLAVLAGVAIVLFSGIIGRRLIETGLAASVVFVGAAIFAKPMLAPPSLITMLPDDTWMFMSVDMLRAFDYNNQYLDAYGKERFFADYAEVLKLMKIQSNLKDTMDRAVKLSAGWVSRETVIGVSGNQEPRVVLFIGSRNRRVAERNFPELLKLSTDSVKGMAKSATETNNSEDFAELDKLVTFEKRPYNNIDLYCSKASSGDPGFEGLCWASVKNAVVVTFSEKVLKETLDSMAKPRTERQKNFTRISKGTLKKSDQLMLVYFDLQQFTATMGDSEIKDQRVKKELDAVNGFSLEVGVRGLSSEVALSAHLDKNKVGGTEIVRQIIDFKSAPHKVDAFLNSENALAFASMNNVKQIIEIMRREMPNEFRDVQEVPLFSDQALGALGDEIGVTLLDVGVSGDQPDIKMVVAMELNPQQKDSRAIIENALYTTLQQESGITLQKPNNDVIAIQSNDMPPNIAPQIGFSDRYVYFTLDAATMADFRGKKKGKGTREKAVLQVKLNTGPAMAGLGEILNAVLSGKGAQGQQPQQDFTKLLNSDTIPIKELSLFVATGPDRIDVILKQEVSMNKMRAFSFRTILDYTVMPNFLRAQSKANYTATVQQLKNIASGMEQEISEMGNLANAYDENGVCHHILPGYDRAADCSGLVRKRFDEIGVPGTLSVATDNNFQYEIRGQANDRSQCKICVTEVAVRPQMYDPAGACLAFECVH